MKIRCSASRRRGGVLYPTHRSTSSESAVQAVPGLREQLGEVGFVRVHRSLLVNSLQVLSVRRGPRGRQLVKLNSGEELPVGRQFEGNTRAFVTIAHRSSLRS
jgi:hypothetical protein